MISYKRLCRIFLGNNLLFILIIPTFASWKKICYETLATLVLPSKILEFFTIVSVRKVGSEFHISLDERMDKALADDANFESKGFMEAVNITDFPIRDHKVILKVRRRR